MLDEQANTRFTEIEFCKGYFLENNFLVGVNYKRFWLYDMEEIDEFSTISWWRWEENPQINIDNTMVFGNNDIKL